MISQRSNVDISQSCFINLKCDILWELHLFFGESSFYTGSYVNLVLFTIAIFNGCKDAILISNILKSAWNQGTCEMTYQCITLFLTMDALC